VAAKRLVRGEPPLIAPFLLAEPPTLLVPCWRRRRCALYMVRDDLRRSGLVDDELLTLGDGRLS
jgi:hypothetical protein